MAISNALFSSAKDYWETPQKLFDSLNEEFNFTIDVAANETNHKLPRYFTKEIDALTQDWGGDCILQSSLREKHSPVGQKV